VIPEDLLEETETEQLLRPGVDGLQAAHRVLETVQGMIVLVLIGLVLVLAGAKLERFLLKRQLEVLDGAEPEPEPAREASRGRRP
jgi:hypothetical protein